jgi:chaperonin GroEL (HSP60 family)
MKNTFKNQKLFYEAISDTIFELEKKIQGIQNSLSQNLEKTPGKTYHLLAKLLQYPRNPEERIVFNHLLSVVYKAEVTSHGAGFLAITLFIELSKELIKLSSTGAVLTHQTTTMQTFDEFYSRIYELINANSKPIQEKQFRKIISEICEDDVLAVVITKALYLAGLEGKLFVENGKAPHYVVESKTGYEFKCKPFDWFLDKYNNSWQRPQCKVLLVDGLIESVSEIEGILNALYEHKQPMAIIAQGFSEEVVATLKANQEKGNFDAIPIRIMPDVNSLNMINDMSCVCNTQHITHLKGQMLAFVKYEELPTIEYVKCYKDTLVLENSSSAAFVNDQIRYLLEKRAAESAIEDIQNIIDLRLRSLAGNSVVISLPDMAAANTDSIRIKADNALRASKALLNYGICNVSQITAKNANSMLENVFCNVFNKTIAHVDHELPVLSVAIATLLSYKGCLLLLSSRGAIVNDTFSLSK